MKKIGLIINPIAGMGGRVGLKGTDGLETVQKAYALGARPEAAAKASRALQVLLPVKDTFTLISCPGEMGEQAARQCGFKVHLLNGSSGQTRAADTEKAVGMMVDLEVDLIMFAGGDGTARNVYNGLKNSEIPVIGIPAGVKMHSAVYATSPRSAGELARLFLQNSNMPTRRAEVMDIDEIAFREGRLSARLYGYLLVPCAGELMQHLKIGGAVTEESALEAIAEQVVENMEENVVYIIGPGSTTAPIMKKLGLNYTLLGVDLVCNGKLIAGDASENTILNLIKERPAKIVVTVIGGQGYIFGRGNQQISAAVISKVGKDNIIVVATREKILILENKRLLADCGDDEVNQMLEGYIRIVTGYREELIYPLSS